MLLLGEAIGMDLVPIQTEKGVGAFSCDILAKDVATERFVAIENQLQATDHPHLGQLLTYAAGLDAQTVIWVSRQMREEHRQALDWLNSKTDEDISFFGVQVELWRIGTSKIAPKFNVVSRPNAFQRAARQSSEAAAGKSAAGQLYLGFFTQLKEALAIKAPKLRTMSPSTDKWTNISLGRGGYQLVIEVSIQKQYMKVMFYVNDDLSKSVAEYLEQQLDDITASLPGAFLDRNDGLKHTSVDILREADISDPSQRDEQIDWLSDTVLRFERYFRPRVKKML